MKLKDLLEADLPTSDPNDNRQLEDQDDTDDAASSQSHRDIGEIADEQGFVKSKTEMFAFGATRPVTLLTKDEKLGGTKITLQYVINPSTGAWSLRACLAGQPEEDMVEVNTGQNPASLAKNLQKKRKITPHQAAEFLNPPSHADDSVSESSDTVYKSKWALAEMLNTRADVKWTTSNNGYSGVFDYQNQQFEIQLDEYELTVNNKKLDLVDFGFTSKNSHLPTNDNKSPSAIFGIVLNAVSHKLKELNPGVILFGVHYRNELASKRKSLYDKLASWYAKGSSYQHVFGWIKTPNGEYKGLSRIELSKADIDQILLYAASIPVKP